METKQNPIDIIPDLSNVLKDYRSLVCTVGEFLQREITPKESLIETLMYKPSLIEIFGWRGRGKSFFGVAMAKALGTGEALLGRYLVNRKCYTLTIDGEMDDPDAVERFRNYMADSSEALDRCMYLSSAETFKQLDRGFNFNNQEDQEILLSILAQLEQEDRRPDVLFFDNLSCLCATDENSNTEQEAYLVFFRNLRHQGYVVVFFHHSGKDGNQRGASRREDFCNLCIELAEHPEAEDGRCMFLLQFTKTRGRSPKPARLLCELNEQPEGRLIWLTSIPEGKNKNVEKSAIYLKWIAEHRPTYQLEIAQAHGISAQAIGKHIDKLQSKGYLDGLTVSEKGRKFLSAIFDQPPSNFRGVGNG